MTYVNLEIADKYQEFFNFMSSEHNLILTIEEMDEVIFMALKFKEEFDDSNMELAINCDHYNHGTCYCMGKYCAE